MASVLLLPTVVEPLKDAARATKDAMGQVVHKVREVTVSQRLDLPQFVVTEYQLVLSDLERRCAIAVLPERSKERLERWFDGLSTAERRAIRVVSIDMWEPYRRAVRAKLPQAQLVAGRFHMMKQLI